MELQPVQSARWQSLAIVVMTFAGTAALLGSKFLAALPIRAIAAISGPLSTIGWWLAKSRRRVALINLRLCFPDLLESERESIAPLPQPHKHLLYQ